MCQGSAIAMPSALASLLRAMAQPSLLDSTITGRPAQAGPEHAFAADVEVVAVDQRVHAAPAPTVSGSA
jgi:hypothetical protein